MKKFAFFAVSVVCCLLVGCSSAAGKVKLDKNKPVNLTIWHYYNGSQKTAFDNLVLKFNETEGKRQGIYVESHSKGNVNGLEKAVISSSLKEVGSDEMPNIFSAYADTAYEIEKSGILADLSEYLTEEELREYEDSYIEEGRTGADGELRIFPIAKSTEVLMVNETIWKEFSAAVNVAQTDFKTVEGIAHLAEQYYNWTDEATPDIANDGKAFYGRDAMANLFIISSMQMGVELFHVENQEVTLNVDRAVFKNIWDTYYIPYVKGYLGAYGRFRSDDVKIGKLVACTGSVASAGYFPDQVELGEVITPISSVVLPAPYVQGGEPYIIQQGAGMAVTKKSAREEYASVQFLKWFTELQHNMEFCSSSGYLPVRKSLDKKQVLDEALNDQELELPKKVYDTFITAFEMVDSNALYTNKAFGGGRNARKILEFNMADKAKADREQVELKLSQGMALDEAAADFISDEEFNAWFLEIKSELEDCISAEKQKTQK